LHGGNRLGGNSLAEIVVFGRLVGTHLASTIKKVKVLPLDQAQITSGTSRLEKLCSVKTGSNPIKVKEDLQQMMWEHAGVIRDGKRLKLGIKKLKSFQAKKLHVTGSLKNNQKLIAALDIANMIPVSQMILEAALLRKESRAAHFRSDFQKTSKAWEKNIIITPKGIKKQSIKKPSPAVQKQLKWWEKRKQSSALLE
jgi:fumarate reductase (CoM/CoB) subunit A